MEWIELILTRLENLGVWALPVETAFKSLLLMAVTLAGVRLLAGRSAALRQALWTAGLIGLLVLPILTVAGPRWQVAIEKSVPVAALPATETAALLPEVDAYPEGASVEAPAASTRARLWLAAVYLAGVAAVLTRWLIGIAALRRRVRTCRPVGNLAWRRDLCRLGRTLGIRQSVCLLESERIQAPLTWGVFNPVILLPSDALQWPEGVRRTVLLHELIHVRRRDLLIENLTQMACAFYWFNPLVWWAGRQLRLEREKACDDAVLGFGTRPSDYARQLLFMAARTGQESVGVAMAARRQLEGRLLAILDPKRRTARFLPTLGVTALTAAAVVGPLAAFSPVLELIPEISKQDSAHRQTLRRDDLTLAMKGAAIVDGEVELEPDGWLRIEDLRSPHRVVELRRAGEVEMERSYVVDGQDAPWDASADELLQRALEMILDAERAREELRQVRLRLEEDRERTQASLEEAHSRMEQARQRMAEQQHREMELRHQGLQEAHERHARELEQTHQQLARVHARLQQRVEGEMQSVMEAERVRLQELRAQLDSEASPEERQRVERAIARQQQEMAELRARLNDRRDQHSERIRRQHLELESVRRRLDEQHVRSQQRLEHELAEIRARSEQQLAEAHQRMREAHARLEEVHTRLEARVGEVESTVEAILLEALGETGWAATPGDLNRVEATARRLVRAGSLDIRDEGWTLELTEGTIAEMAAVLANGLTDLTEAQREQLTERLQQRLTVVNGR